MKSLLKRKVFTALMMLCYGALSAQTISFKITKRYLNLPVSQAQERGIMQFKIDDKLERSFKIRLAAQPEYWVFCDMAALQGKTITISYDGKSEGLSKPTKN